MIKAFAKSLWFLLRRLVQFAYIVFLITLIVWVILFARANDHSVMLQLTGLTPFAQTDANPVFEIPLFLLLMICLITGIFLGGMVVHLQYWLRRHRHRHDKITSASEQTRAKE